MNNNFIYWYQNFIRSVRWVINGSRNVGISIKLLTSLKYWLQTEMDFMRSLSPGVISGWSRGGAQGNRRSPPPYFLTKLRPEGRKKIFLDTFSEGLDDRGPALSQSVDPALVIDRFVDFVIKFRCLW